jgi:endonuclease YncB( thermonuclease family)
MRMTPVFWGRLLCLAVLPILFTISVARADDYISGRASVVDGGHLKIGGKTYALYGIDAPALDGKCAEWQGIKQVSYACGQHAKAFLASIAAARDFVCVTAEGHEGQITCYADGRDVADSMVQAGWAVACDYASRYVQQATAARTARVGLWAGNFNTMGKCPVTKLPAAAEAAPKADNLPPASTFKESP